MENSYDIDVSIIVPAYNEERNIRKCIETINSAEPLFSWNIIIVNDGSSDSTDDVCKAIIQEFRNVKYFHQANSGVAVARNSGIKLSSGKWIMFVDADDTLDRDWTKKVYKVIKSDEYQIIQANIYYEKKQDNCYSYKTFEVDSNKVKLMLLNRKRYYASEVFSNNLVESVHGVVGKLFLRKTLIDNNIEFPCGIALGEDILFYLSALESSTNCLFYDSPLYFVHSNVNSSTSRFNIKMIQGAFDFCHELEKRYPQWIDENEFCENKAFQMYWHILVGVVDNIIKGNMKNKESRRIIDEVNKDPVTRQMLLYISKNRMKPLKVMSITNKIVFLLIKHNFLEPYIWGRKAFRRIKATGAC